MVKPVKRKKLNLKRTDQMNHLIRLLVYEYYKDREGISKKELRRMATKVFLSIQKNASSIKLGDVKARSNRV